MRAQSRKKNLYRKKKKKACEGPGNAYQLTVSSRWLWVAFTRLGVSKVDSSLINSDILNVELLKYQSLVILHLEG